MGHKICNKKFFGHSLEKNKLINSPGIKIYNTKFSGNNWKNKKSFGLIILKIISNIEKGYPCKGNILVA